VWGWTQVDQDTCAEDPSIVSDRLYRTTFHSKEERRTLDWAVAVNPRTRGAVWCPKSIT
jgi:hypothetical protein